MKKIIICVFIINVSFLLVAADDNKKKAVQETCSSRRENEVVRMCKALQARKYDLDDLKLKGEVTPEETEELRNVRQRLGLDKVIPKKRKNNDK